MDSTNAAKNAWDRIVSWLESHKRGKAVLPSFRAPASAAAIARFEKKAKVALPPALATIYQLLDGQDEDAANESLDGETIESGLFPSIEGRGDLPFRLVPLSELSRGLNSRMPGFRKGWIPFGDNYGGDNMVLDFASTDPKKRGRVLQFNHEYGAAFEVAESFEKYLEHIADGLSSKKIVWDDDSGLSYRKGKDWDDLIEKKQVECEEQEDEQSTKAPKPKGIVGRWQVYEFVSPPGGMLVICGFQGDTVDFSSGGDFVVRPPAADTLRGMRKYRYRCDNKHDPAWIDVYDSKFNEHCCLGIYHIDGDKLVVCTGKMFEPRATRFDPKENDPWIIYRLARV